MAAPDPTSPSDPSPTLSPDTLARLRDAIAAHWRSSETESEETRAVLRTVAREARERGVYPESLIVALKKLEADTLRDVRDHSPVARRQFTEWLVTACLRAYYDE